MPEVEIASLVTGKNMALAIAASIVTSGFKQGFPDLFACRSGHRILPVLPLILALVGSLAGLGEAATLADRIVLGILAGAVASYGYKLGRTTVFGRGAPPRSPRGRP